jgi:hypothetical protein
MHNIVILLPIKLLFILETRMSFAARPELLADRRRMPRHDRERDPEPRLVRAPSVTLTASECITQAHIHLRRSYLRDEERWVAASAHAFVFYERA